MTTQDKAYLTSFQKAAFQFDIDDQYTCETMILPPQISYAAPELLLA
jgi:hypothetical protein